MKVGHGVEHLELVEGEAMGGYADRPGGLAGVLDPLEVHAVTFADRGRRFALVVADLVCVNTDVVARVRAAVREAGVGDCWVAATHTHAGPEPGCAPGGAPTPAHLAGRLERAALRAVAGALADERDATVHTDRVRLPELAGRRHLAGHQEVDLPVDVLVVTSDGRVTGTIVVSPVHPTVLPAAEHRASADLSGGIRRALRSQDRWVVAATGAAGDISTRHTRRGRDERELDRLGALVAGRLSAVTHPPGARTEAAPDEQRLTPPTSARVPLTAKRPEEARSDGVTTHGRSQDVLDQGRTIARDLMATGPGPREIDVEAVTLGPVTLVAIPGELYLDLGERIRARGGEDVVVLGYANGYLGYLPTQDAPTSYETLVSPVARGSGEAVVAAALDLIAQRAAQRIAQ
ncbi:hypothetical protein OIE66_24065 [Nonomuraea sp. NBC_01738]|uniref:hypothetical protein n=1 Tax=Nonomuraea sp. NBC_01738 TaxID=2976003 RepID=UPI002E140C8D|nr:hypothetical protein OIE66_24065 [Nonomuraea sp. NBC_01738]